MEPTKPPLPFELIMGVTLMTTIMTMILCACIGMFRARYWERRRPSPEVDPEEVQRLAGALRALANEVSALVAEEPAKPKEHAGVT